MKQRRKSIDNSHSPITPTAKTRLHPGSTVSQLTTCHVIRWPPYMASKRPTITNYGIHSICRCSRDVPWRPGLRCSQACQCLVLCMQHAASQESSLTHIHDNALSNNRYLHSGSGLLI